MSITAEMIGTEAPEFKDMRSDVTRPAGVVVLEHLCPDEFFADCQPGVVDPGTETREAEEVARTFNSA